MRRLTVFIVVIGLVWGSAPVLGQGSNRAGIVVSFGDGRVESACVEFTETEISGAELMDRAGFSVVLGSGGDTNAVCMIGDTGCQNPADCWCQCHGAGCRYWSYHRLDGSAWKYSAVGASSRKVHNGDVDGWAWGKGGVGSGAEPELRTFDEICPPIAASTSPAVPTSLPTMAPEPTSEVAAATAPPPAATTLESKPAATATVHAPTGTPIGPSPTKAAPATEDAGSFPWQLPAFAVVAVGLLGTAAALANRRVRGKRG